MISLLFSQKQKNFSRGLHTVRCGFSLCNCDGETAILLQKTPISVAIDRDLSFELVYSPAIKDSTVRRYTISNALNLMQICRGKNVIISSAAERPLEIRGPYDVANLGLLFGLTENTAKAAVSTNCRAALLHGETRKLLLELSPP